MSAQADPKTLRRRLQKIETGVIGTLVTAALGIFLYGPLARAFVPSLAIDWSEEVAIYLVVWASLLSGGTLASRREHISAEFLSRSLSQRARLRLRIGIDALVLAFALLMTGLGAQAVLFAHGLDERSASTLQAPQAWALYLALPAGMLLIAIRTAILLLHGAKDTDA